MEDQTKRACQSMEVERREVRPGREKVRRNEQAPGMSSSCGCALARALDMRLWGAMLVAGCLLRWNASTTSTVKGRATADAQGDGGQRNQATMPCDASVRLDSYANRCCRQRQRQSGSKETATW